MENMKIRRVLSALSLYSVVKVVGERKIELIKCCVQFEKHGDWKVTITIWFFCAKQQQQLS
jgi:hypothetical protein